MSSAGTDRLDLVDLLDRKILHALQVNGRAPFALVGEVLGVSEQTVARRYRRLRRSGVVRVVGLLDPASTGQLDWMIRITSRPKAAAALAAALARRSDVAWVSLTGAGNEIVASLRARTEDVRDELLLQQLPNTEQVLNLSAVIVMHRYTGRHDLDWGASGDQLEEAALAALVASRPSGPAADDEHPTDRAAPLLLQPEDRPLLAALAADGRTSISSLAAAAGCSPGRARRRLDALLSSGLLYLDVDIAMPALGYPLLSMLWLTVEPQHLDTFGAALIGQDAVTFAGATTGASNIAAAVALNGVDALYRFVNRVGELAPGLRQLEVAPVIRRIKQAGSMVDGARLRELAPRPG